MKTVTKKVIELEEHEKDTLRAAIRVLEDLCDEGAEADWMDHLISDLQDVVYIGSWEVETYD